MKKKNEMNKDIILWAIPTSLASPTPDTPDICISAHTHKTRRGFYGRFYVSGYGRLYGLTSCMDYTWAAFGPGRRPGHVPSREICRILQKTTACTEWDSVAHERAVFE